jgi:hypothetical protein
MLTYTAVYLLADDASWYHGDSTYARLYVAMKPAFRPTAPASRSLLSSRCDVP